MCFFVRGAMRACCPGRAGPRKRLVANSCRACGAWPTYLAVRGRLAAPGCVSEDPEGGREGGVPAWAKASERTQSANDGNRQGMSTHCARNVSAKSWKKGRGDGVVLRTRDLLNGKRLVLNINVTDKLPSRSSAASGARW